MIACTCAQTWHGWTYATDGEGLVVVQALGEVLDACSNLVMMLMLLMMARGWTGENRGLC